jgi:hypothetical protein
MVMSAAVATPRPIFLTDESIYSLPLVVRIPRQFNRHNHQYTLLAERWLNLSPIGSKYQIGKALSPHAY